MEAEAEAFIFNGGAVAAAETCIVGTADEATETVPGKLAIDCVPGPKDARMNGFNLVICLFTRNVKSIVAI